MDFFEFLQKFFLLLLPGTLGTYLFYLLNIHKEEHYYFEFLKIVIFSFISYLLSDFLISIIKFFVPCFIYSPINIIQQIASPNTTIPTPNVVWAIVVSLLLACLFTKAVYQNWLFKIANFLNLTGRIDNQPVWEHFFDDNDIVILRDSVTKNIYYGKVYSYSDNSPNREICFSDVYVYDQNSEFLYHAQKLYLSRAHNEFTIEMQDENDTVNQNKGVIKS